MIDSTLVTAKLKTIAWEEVMCPRCEARPGDDCVTLSGEDTGMHSGRYQPLMKAYVMGHGDTEREWSPLAKDAP